MSNQWMDLLDQFRSRLEILEQEQTERGVMGVWRRWCLEQALDLLEENPDAASKHLENFNRTPAPAEVVGISEKFFELPKVKDIRTRFDTLGGGIV